MATLRVCTGRARPPATKASQEAAHTRTIRVESRIFLVDFPTRRDISYNPEHHDRMKHVQRRHFFVRDMVEAFELEVPYVPTAENPADFLTKPQGVGPVHGPVRAVVESRPLTHLTTGNKPFN